MRWSRRRRRRVGVVSTKIISYAQLLRRANNRGGMKMAIQEKFVQVGEYRTHYWKVGEGENVLMLHSADPGSGGWLEFRENMEALGKQFRVLAPYANYTATRENLQAHLGRAYFNPDRWAPPQIFDQYLEASARQYGSYAKLGCYPMDVPNLRPLLAKMTVPVLFVTGKENKILPIEQALIAFNMTPGAKLYAMSSCGLHAQTEHPQEFNRIAVEFLKGELN